MKIYLFALLSLTLLISGCGGGSSSSQSEGTSTPIVETSETTLATPSYTGTIPNIGTSTPTTPDTGNTDNTSSNSAPQLSGEITVEQIAADSIKVSWAEATDDTTSSPKMDYEIHVSETENFTPDSTTLHTKTFGVTEAEVGYLETNKTYYVQVVAMDENGNSSLFKTSQSTILAVPTEPQFSGLSFSAPTDTDKVFLSWQAASDDQTNNATMQYEIHVSQEENFVLDANTLHSRVTGQTETLLTGLSPGTTYYMLVQAIDQDNNYSTSKQYHSVTTLLEPVVVNTNATFYTDEDLGLSGVIQTGTQYSFSTFDTTKLPNINDILFININDEMHMRKVLSVSVDTNQLNIDTTDAMLSEILDEATIRTKVTFSDDMLVFPASTARRAELEREFAAKKKLSEFCSVASNGVIKAHAGIDFKPEFDFDLDWEKQGLFRTVLTSGHAVARGTLTASIGYSVDIKDATASCNVDKTLKTFRSVQVYTLGPVPVAQVTTLTIKGKADIKVNAKLKSEAEAKAVGSASIGAVFNSSTNTWEKSSESPTLDFDLNDAEAFPEFEGVVSGNLHLIPELSVRFYAIVGPKISIDPSFSAEIKVADAQPLLDIGRIPAQVTGFDVSTALDVNIGIDLGIFGDFVKLKDKELYSKSWILLSLPSLSVSGGSGKVDTPITVTGNATNGVNNNFSDSSIQWDVNPSASISGGKTASLTASQEDTYTVFFSGTGETTSAIRQLFPPYNHKIYKLIPLKAESLQLLSHKTNQLSSANWTDRIF